MCSDLSWTRSHYASHNIGRQGMPPVKSLSPVPDNSGGRQLHMFNLSLVMHNSNMAAAAGQDLCRT